MTFNIRLGAGSDSLDKPARDVPSSTRKLQAVSAAIGSVQPDVVALQEVRTSHQLHRIAHGLGMGYAFVSHPTGYTLFQWGMGVLSRFPLTETKTQPIVFDENIRIGKVGLRCTLHAQGRQLDIYNVHFHPQGLAEQVDATLRFIADAVHPVVLMGDLNRAPGAGVLAPIRERLLDTCSAAETETARRVARLGTYPPRGSRIDYIFVDPLVFRVVDAGLVPDAHHHVSDHIAYFADVAWIE